MIFLFSHKSINFTYTCFRVKRSVLAEHSPISVSRRTSTSNKQHCTYTYKNKKYHKNKNKYQHTFYYCTKNVNKRGKKGKEHNYDCVNRNIVNYYVEQSDFVLDMDIIHSTHYSHYYFYMCLGTCMIWSDSTKQYHVLDTSGDMLEVFTVQGKVKMDIEGWKIRRGVSLFNNTPNIIYDHCKSNVYHIEYVIDYETRLSMYNNSLLRDVIDKYQLTMFGVDEFYTFDESLSDLIGDIDIADFEEQGKTYKQNNKKKQNTFKKIESNVSVTMARDKRVDPYDAEDEMYDEFLDYVIVKATTLNIKDNSKRISDVSHMVEHVGDVVDSSLIERVKKYCMLDNTDDTFMSMVSQIMHIVFTVEGFFSCDKPYSQFLFIASYFSAKLSMNTSLLRHILSLVLEEFGVLKSTVACAIKNMGNQSMDIMVEQGMFDGIRSMIRSSTFRHTSVILSGLATAGFVAAGNFTVGNFTLFRYNCLTPNDDGLDFLDRTFEALDYFLDRGWKCFQTLSIKPMMYGEDDLTELVNMVSECKTGILAYKQGNYTRMYGQRSVYFDDLIQRTGAKVKLCKILYTKGHEAKLVEDQRSKYLRINEIFISFKKSMQCRVAPLFIKIFAGSGVGKSSLCSYTSNAILDYNGYLNSPEHTVSLSTVDKYDSNARTNVSCYILDDMANTKANLAVQNPAELIIRLKNNVPTTANMAEAEDKGKIFFEPKLLVATTNNRTLDAPYWSVSAKSVLRRVDIHVSVKPNPLYSVDGMLRATPGNQIEDLWLVTIETPSYRDEKFERWSTVFNPISDDDSLHRLDVPYGTPLKDISIYDYLRYICWFSKTYYATQDSVVDHISEVRRNLSKCEVCNLPGRCCRCLPIVNVSDKENQSLSMSLAYSYFINPMVSEWNSSIRSWVSDAFDRLLIQPMEWKMLQGYSTAQIIRLRSSVSNPILSVVHSLVPHTTRTQKWYGKLYKYMRRSESHCIAVRAFLGASVSIFGYGLLDLCGFAPISFSSNTYARSCSVPVFSYVMMRNIHSNRIDEELLERNDFIDKYVEQAQAKMAKYKQEHNLTTWNTVVAPSLVGVTAGALLIALHLIRDNSGHKGDIKGNEQALLHPVGSGDVSCRNKFVNVWEPSAMLGNVGTTMTGEQLCNLVMGNTMRIEYTDGIRKGSCNCVFVQTGWLLMPYHVWFKTDGPKIDINSSSFSPMMQFTFLRGVATVDGVKQVCHTFSGVFTFEQAQRIGGHDLCLVNARIGGDFKSLIKYMPINDTAIDRSGLCTFQLRTRAGEINRYPASYQRQIITYDRPCGNVTYCGGLSQSKYVFASGDCCGVYITDTTYPIILGFHLLGTPSSGWLPSIMMGTQGQGGFGTLYQSDIVECLEHCSINNNVFKTAYEPTLYSHSVGVPVKINADEHSRNLSKYVEPCKFRIIGTLGTPSTYRTEYKPSFMFKDIVDQFGECKYKPPDFATTNTWKPFEVYLNNINNGMFELDSKILSYAIRDYVGGFMEILSNSPVKAHIRPLSEKEIVNGITGVRFIDAMNMNSSIGFPFKGPKRKHILEHDCGDGTIERSFLSPSIMESVTVNEERYRLGCSNMLIFNACLKDEIIPKYKNGICNTKIRVFTAAGIESQLLIRKYFLPLGMLLSTYPLVSECAVGINSFGPEYSELTGYLRTFGEDRIMCGDYSSWDQMLSPQLTSAAFYVLIRLAHLSGNYSKDDVHVMEGIANDIIHPLVNVNGVLLKLYGSNPSGQNMTSYVNSICNSLLIRCAFYTKFRTFKPGVFRDYIKNITYGDDIKACVSRDIDFGFNYYRGFLSEHNIKFTAADKIEADVYADYMHESKASFLKRYTVWIEPLQAYVGVLDESSVNKSFYYLKKSNVGPKNVVVSIFQSALHEVFFMGETKYNYYLQRINLLCDKYKLYFPELHVTYQQRVETWQLKYSQGYVDEYPFIYQPQLFVGEYEEQSSTLYWLPQYWRTVGFKECYLLNMDVFSKHCIHAGCVGINIHNTQKFGNNNKNKEVPDGQVNSLMLVEHSKTIREWIFSTFEEQSEDKQVTMQMEGNNVVQFTTTERDMQVEIPYVRDNTFRILHTPDVSLSEFLSRPIRVYQATFLLGAGYELQFNASKIFLQSIRVANRISNYAYISGKIHIKFILNGSPFHYGKVICAYEPLPSYGSKTTPGLNTVQAMMLPYVSCDVSSTEGSILSYDLMNPYGAIDLTDLDNPVNIADLVHVHTLGAVRAVGDTNDPIELEAYAWMTDVKLSMPTVRNITGLVEQSEHNMKPATLPTVVGSVGTVLGNMVRIIKPYAVASYDAVGMGLKVAAAFGFSRPTIIPEIRHIQNKPFGNFSHCNVPDSSVKLSLDAKNETTVDPATCGFDPVDELTIVSMGKREFYMSQLNWQTTDTARDVLWHAAVTPCVSYSDVEGRICAPSYIAAAPFRYWRGTTYYRIEIVSSPFHRGMLRIVFDPIDQLNSASFLGDTTDNIHYSHTIDISKEKNYEFCVGMGTPKNYLRTIALPDSEQYGPNGLDLSSGQSRISYPGYIAIQVLLPLTTTVAQGATAVNDVYINVYMRMGDDFEVADPTMANIQSYTPLADPNAPGGRIGNGELIEPLPLEPVNADELEEQANNVGVMNADGGLVDYNSPVSLCLNMVDEFIDDGRLSSIHFGEKITSLRQIIKRPTLHGVHVQPYPANLCRHRISFPSYPVYRGTSLPGNPVYGTYNLCRTGPLTWLGPCFVGWRGGIRWKVYTTFDRNDLRIYQDGVSRSNFGYSGFVNNLQTYIGGLSDSSLSAWSNNNGVRYETGSSVNQTEICRVHEVEIPYHYITRFVPHCLYPELVSATNLPELPTNFYVDGLYSSPEISRGFRNMFVSAGDDFGFYFFKYSPYIRSVQLNE